jgi:hypothetical protein
VSSRLFGVSLDEPERTGAPALPVHHLCQGGLGPPWIRSPNLREETVMSNEKVELIRAAYEAYARGDLAGFHA